jgi:hypothetical protein
MDRPTKRPTKIKIGHIDYTIEWVDATWAMANSRTGEADFVQEIIRVVGTLSPYSLADTFLHEIAHVLLEHYDAGSSALVSRENMAKWVGAGIVMVIRDNPEAFRWWCELIAPPTGSVV